MKLVVANQCAGGEPRVALDPAAAKKLVALKLQVTVEAGLGKLAGHGDDAYMQAGATVVEGDAFNAAWAQADVALTVHMPDAGRCGALPSQAVLIGMLAPLGHKDRVLQLRERQITSFSMEFLPRISRAQSMDVLSSQANIAGYKAVLLAANACPKMFPMMITAAGTISPSKVFIIGAGVAGLQAIATAKRLGAVVEAIDVRPETKEQVQSLGARFVELPSKQDSKSTGGYAREQTAEERQAQQDLQKKHIVGADCVITTAAVFGKAPPMLVPANVVGEMRAGSVLVDMAADPAAGRGNCELTKPGEIYTTERGVTLIGTLNLPGLVPSHASQAYASNMVAFLKEIVADGALKLDLDDEVQKGACITHAGEIRNALVAKTLQPT